MSTALFDLTAKTALVTGSSRGLGRAIAEGLGRAGASLIVNGASAAMTCAHSIARSSPPSRWTRPSW